MPTKTPQEELMDVSVEDLQRVLDARGITPRAYNALVREKARLTNLEILRKEGFVGGVFHQSLVEQLEKGWSDLLKGVLPPQQEDVEKDIAVRYPTATPEEQAKLVQGAMNVATGANVGQVLYGLFEIMAAPVFAVGIATGTKIESLLLDAGASEGVARFFGLVTELGIGPARVGSRGIVVATEATAPEIPRLLALVRDVAEKTKIAKAFELMKSRNTEISQAMVEQAASLARRAVTEGTEEAERAFARHMTVLFTGSETPKVRYTHKMVRLLTEWSPEQMARGDLRDAMRNLAEDIMTMRADQLGHLTDFAQMARARGGVLAGMREIWNNTFVFTLSVPTALVGNVVTTSIEVAKRFAGGGPAYGAAFFRGLFISTHDALKVTASRLKVDATRLDQVAVESQGVVGGILGRILTLDRLPIRGLNAVDNLFDPRIRRASYLADAELEGRALALTGDKLAEFIRKRLAKPTDEMLRRASSLADELTFRTELGPFQGAIRDLAQAGPLFFYFPVMKTGINAVNYTWAHTPGLQFVSRRLYDDLAAGGARAADARGRIFVANMVAFYTYELAKNGFVTGSGPSNPQQRAGWLATHEPYTIGVPGGTRVSYRGWDQGFIALVADYAQAVDQMDPRTYDRVGQAVWFSIYKNLGKNEWWGDVDRFLSIAERGMTGDLTEKDLKVLAEPAVRVATGGAVGQRLRQATDPETREAGSVLDEVLNRTPSFSLFGIEIKGSKSLPLRRDLYGDPVIPALPPGSSWFGFFSPILPRIKDATADRLKTEGDRLSIETGSAFFPWTYKGVPLTTDQRDRWIQTYNVLLRDPGTGLARRTVDDPRYQREALASQKELFEGMLATYRQTAMRIMLSEDKEFADKLYRYQEQERHPKVPQSQRTPSSLFNLFIPRAAEGAELTLEERDNLSRWAGEVVPELSTEGMPETHAGFPEGTEIEVGVSAGEEGKPKPLEMSIGYQPGVGEVPIPETETPEATEVPTTIIP